MTLKHTPGQWEAHPDPNAYLQDDWCVGVGDSIDEVAVCSERDAHLIAAAPDLLEALLVIKKFMGADFYDLPMANRACAAIAKATNTL